MAKRSGLVRALGLGAAGAAGWWLRDLARRPRRVALPPPAPARAEPPTPVWTQSTVAGPAGDLFVHRGGHGPRLPVLLMHGLGGTWEVWHPLLCGLASDRRVAAHDLRGHGASAPGATARIEDHAADAVAVLDALGWPRAAVVGHSLGAWAALALAARDPGRIVGVVLVDPPGDTSEAEPEELEALLAAVRADPQGQVRFQYRQLLAGGRESTRELVLERLAATPGAELVAGVEATMRFAPEPSIAAYDGPIVALTSPLADGPWALPRRHSRIWQRHLPGTCHWPMLDDPGAVGLHLSDFLGRLDRPT